MPRRGALILCSLPVVASGCTNFYMNFTNSDYRLAGRSEDMSDFIPDLIHSFPRNRTANPPNSMTWVARYGFLGFCGARDPFVQDPMDNVYEGFNEVGLSCSSLTMIGTRYPEQPNASTTRNLNAPFMCRWVMENFATVDDAKTALADVHVFARPHGMSEHFYLADEHGHGLAVEWVDGEMQLTLDYNDGTSGFGIMTNAPPFKWQVQNAHMFDWKRQRPASAVPLPGGFYPDDRFLRVHALKTAIESTAQPRTYREAVSRVVSILNTVDVPPAAPASDHEGDHTKWQVVRDHKNRRVFWRACDTPSWQLINVKALALEAGSAVSTLSTELPAGVPWYRDLTSEMSPKLEQPRKHASNLPSAPLLV
mmetsp:Transcript_48796/g.139604  ORF Transcript_48796/g.139604 Transcript_48796/m.139604 type:complete len:366 (-) Transcript_48796:252-1349(-)